jgi:hypothetical protein
MVSIPAPKAHAKMRNGLMRLFFPAMSFFLRVRSYFDKIIQLIILPIPEFSCMNFIISA